MRPPDPSQCPRQRCRPGLNLSSTAGQVLVKGKFFRISRRGQVKAFDIMVVHSALEMTLQDLGYPMDGLTALELIFTQI